MKINILTLSAFYRYYFCVGSVTRNDCSLFLNIFTDSNFSIELVTFTAANHLYTIFDLTKWPLQSPRKRPVLKLQIGVFMELFITHADAVVQLVSWWAGAAVLTENLVLHPSAFLTTQNFHPTHQFLKPTKNQPLFQRTILTSLHLSRNCIKRLFSLTVIVFQRWGRESGGKKRGPDYTSNWPQNPFEESRPVSLQKKEIW